MFQKYKVLLLNFDEVLSGAFLEWLKGLGDIDAKSTYQSDEDFQSLISQWLPHIVIAWNGVSDIDSFGANIGLITVGTNASKDPAAQENHFNPPIRFVAIEAKLRQVLRAREQATMAALIIGGHEFSHNKHALIAPNGQELKLTDKEVAILTYLNQADGAPISREELLREVWRYNQGVTTHTLETHIYRLRQKLISLMGEREVLITTEGGYRLQN